MKILHVVLLYPPAAAYGGPSSVARNLAIRLARNGNHVTVATTNLQNLMGATVTQPLEAMEDGVRVLRFPAKAVPRKFSFLRSASLMRWVRLNAAGFDVVHIHFARDWIAWRVARICESANVAVVLQTHGMLYLTHGVRKWVDRVTTRKRLSRANAVLALQQFERDGLARIAPRARIQILENGVDEEVKVGARKRSKDILFFARLHHTKRPMAFLEMAKILIERGWPGTFRLIGPDGGEQARLTRWIAESSYASRFELLGVVDRGRLEAELDQVAMVVLPSVNDPFPMVVLEALAHGAPCVVTDSNHLVPILAAHRAACISKPDPSSLADAVETLLGDPARLQALSVAGQALVRGQLSLAQIAARLEEIYAVVTRTGTRV